MHEKKNILGLIPARGGSKGIRGKNIRPLLGKPLIAYTIESALKSGVLGRVIVSTDSLKIKKLSQRYGAECPFLRPASLARDDTPMISVIRQAVKFMEERENFFPEIIVLLQPTSPLRRPAHIKGALDIFLESRADSLVSLCEARYSPYWMAKLIEGKVVSVARDSQRYTRRQDLPLFYRFNGAIYIAKRDLAMKRDNTLTKNTSALIMKEEDSVDIDTELDFQLAELILKNSLRER